MKKDPQKYNSLKCKINRLVYYMSLGPYHWPPSIVSYAYEHFQTKIYVIGFFIQLKKV